MKRVLLLVPEGLTFDMLSVEQQAAINSVFGQYVNPMPATITHNGMQVVDAVTADNFNPTVMVDFGIDWPIVGIMQWDGASEEVTIIQPLDVELYRQHMPDGTVTECHRWSGWPEGGFNNA